MPEVCSNDDTDDLLERTGNGDKAARGLLLGRHRTRLRTMIALRMDPRLAARVDPSDIVQEALVDANRFLSEYLQQRPLPFYLWLRRLAWEKLVAAQRRHIKAQRRSVKREEPNGLNLADESAAALADKLLASGTSPSGRLVRDEQRRRVLETVAALPERDRELLVLRYLEGLSTAEIATVLEITAGAVMTRHTRALTRLRALFDDDQIEEDES
jgi:RNA polymerase sigma-70 factor (ECF subfamily)